MRIVALKLSAVDGTTINFSALSWAVRSQGHDIRNHVRKPLVSPKPEIKMGVLLGRFPAGRQGLATWASTVVPTGMPLRGPDMSVDMRFVQSPRRLRVRTDPNPWLRA